MTKYLDLQEHYSASFDSIKTDMELVKENFQVLLHKENSAFEKEVKEFVINKNRKRGTELKKALLENGYTAYELEKLKWSAKMIDTVKEEGVERFHENGFDYLATPIVTAEAPGEFRLYRWGFIPFFMNNRDKAMELRLMTLNCISEEMYDKQSFTKAAEEGKRCLIPVTGFYEWRWLDEKGKVKIPYYLSFKKDPVESLAGLYNTWTDKSTGEKFNTYTVLTTAANSMMEYVHNNKKRMPVIIPKQFEKDWLSKSLTKDDVLALCRPIDASAMKANTISKLITSEADSNVAEVLLLHNYEKVGTDEIISEF